MQHDMQTLHLFAGAGGGLLADLILGHTPIGAVEFDPYCCAVLRERTADGWFPNLRVHEGDVRLFDPSEYAGRVDCLHAGFPCQPHSVAGKREGEADERNLWPDTARIIGQLRPRFAFLENVPGIVSNGYAAVVVGELSALGYDCQWGIVSASDANAPHDRERFWCLAKRSDANSTRELQPEGRKQNERRRTSDLCKEVSDPDRQRFQVRDEVGNRGQESGGINKRSKSKRVHTETRPQWWEIEPDVGRVADVVASRAHRIKAIGNGQDPLQAALAWRILGGP